MAHSCSAWYVPGEAHSHTRTWMALGVNERTWGKKLSQGARECVCNVSNTIAEFEPVTLLVTRENMELAKRLCKENVQLVEADLDDIWMRDSGPTFVLDGQGQLAAVDLNFNGWGNKQTHKQDSKVAALVARQVDGCHVLETRLVMEGGGLEVDGEGTAIITESCVLNKNRNRNFSKQDAETELRRLFSLDKIIWLPGIKGEDMTDGHTDFYARFARPGVVIAHEERDKSSPDYAIVQKHIEILQGATDARGRALQVHVIPGPSWIRPQPTKSCMEDFAAGYINFYVCNGGVLAPEFGDKAADEFAKQKLQELFPSREIRMVNIDGVACGGGGVHCITQQQPDCDRVSG